MSAPHLRDRDHGLSAVRMAGLEPGERARSAGSSDAGLSGEEAARRLTFYGSNEPVRREATRHLARFAANFTHTLALLLWFAAGLAFAAGINELGGAIVAVVGVNGVFAFVQEYRAGQVVESLMRRVAVPARVLRDGSEVVVPSEEVVPGDIVRLAAGDIVPADVALLECDELSLDLSMITGETVAVERSEERQVARETARVTELSPIAPASSAVVTGSGLGVVFATGPESTLGRVAALVTGVKRGESVLERQVRSLSRVTAVIAVLAGAVTLVLASLTTNTTFIAALTFATGVIVALVPEGLLPTLTVALAIGARRMAERGAAVRRLSAVEVVGSVTVICTDKTGTLTLNSLSVLGLVPASDEERTNGLLVAAVCNDARLVSVGAEGDLLDAALLTWSRDEGADVEGLRRRYVRQSEVAFEAHRRYMSVTCRDRENGAEIELLKGAPEAVVTELGVEPPTVIREAMEAAASRGERVILLAVRRDGAATISALARIADPPRPEVPAAIGACRRAGVRVAMLTGDHPTTARAVAIAIGLGENVAITAGDELDRMSDLAICEAVRGNAIFARIDPQQKLRIVTALRRAGEVVVATGDGINDAAALRAADVGVAMGRRGTEVAKQAADVVLADDNFATIVAAIEEGRSLKRNIRRFVSYVFTSNVAELTPFVLYIFLPMPLALQVIQALAIDVGTDLVPALALGAEAPSGREMARPPEPPSRPLLTRGLGLRTFLFFGAIEAALGMAGFFAFEWWHGWRPFDSFDALASIEREATTATFLAIVGGQVGCLFAQRDGSLWRRLSLRTNPWVAGGLAFELLLSLALVYVPGLNTVFLMRPLAVGWLLLVPVSAAIFLALDLVRRRIARV